MTNFALSCLAIGSLAIGLSFKAEAFTGRTVLPIENSSIFPKSVEQNDSQLESGQQVAYQTLCQADWINGRYITCCVDSTGNWVCMW